ncbi:putative membrane protein [Collimonas arenae]|uniref:Putative membrane protein n=1 Tax=Collimonas arenae TaxID=279058 RepID=A0A127PTU3_9BURK|nr:Pr6Pr family membrane protein [Collimonas arenae]AMP01197.1 putative membrane protein [Collimonas arenae]AMP11090.1 putative membrane protein [Collimonas arenae]
MNKTSTIAPQLLLALIAIISWFAIVAQFSISIPLLLAKGMTYGEAVWRMFGYLTILTNVLIAVCCTVLLSTPDSALGQFFSRPGVLTALALYIIIVGLGYNILLRNHAPFTGLHWLSDEGLHSAVPLLFTLFWLLYVAKDDLQVKDSLLWLIYPLAYFVVAMIRGGTSGFYPYPFLNVTNLGYARVMANAFMLLIGFFVIALSMVAIAKVRRKELSVE